MPLSADGILGFFDGTTRRCEAFEHVSLATAAATVPTASPTTSAAASPRRVVGTPMLEVNGADFTTYGSATPSATAATSGGGAGGRAGTSSSGSSGATRVVIPTATVVSGTQAATWGAEAGGTLYICALPEVMWNSIAAVTAASAPSQRQLAFSSEAPAFCASRNQSFVQGGRESPQSLRLKAAAAGDGEGSGWGSAIETTQPRNVHLAEEELPEMSAFGPADDYNEDTRTPPRQTQTAKRHGAAKATAPRYADPMASEDPRHQSGLLDSIPSHTAVPPSHLRVPSNGGGVGESEGIQLPDMVANLRQQFSSSIFRSESMLPGGDLRLSPQTPKFTLPLTGLNAYHSADAVAPRPPSPALNASSHPRSGEAGDLSGPSSIAEDALVAGTVTVLLWVAAGAATSARAERQEAEADRATVSPVRLTPTTTNSTATTTVSPRTNFTGGGVRNATTTTGVVVAGDTQKQQQQLMAKRGEFNPRASNSAESAAIGNDGGAASAAAFTATAASLPACLCFSVRDVAKAESCDTDVVTTRERRVQRFTLTLEPGALVYTAKSTSDIFESATSTGSNTPSFATTNSSANNTVGSTNPPLFTNSTTAASSQSSCLRPLPSGGLACAFVFYQGGITRCVASLRRYSPRLIYNCLGSRQHNNNNNSSAHSNNTSTTAIAFGDGSASPFGLSRTASTQIGTQDLHTVDAAGNVSGGAVGASKLSTAATENGQPPQQQHVQAQNAKQSGGGWRNRLSPAGLFRHNNNNNKSHAADAAQNPPQSTSPTSPSLNSGGGGVMKGVGVADRTSGAAAAAKKLRVGPAPERALPGGNDAAAEHSSNSSFEDLTDEMTAVRLGALYVPPKPSLPPVEASGGSVTAAEWAAAFDAAPSLQTPTTPSTTHTSRTPTSGTGKADQVLNAERWRAFRQSVFERGGLADPGIRFEVWCYLLGAYRVGSTASEQQAVLVAEQELYTRLTTQWKSFLPVQEEHFADYRYAKHSILKDVERTDRTHPAFRDDNSDMLRVLQELLLGHVMYNMDLGYSQGMSDVAAVASLVAPPAQEAAMFLCLRRMLSEHMANNFIIEERKKDAPYAAVKGLQRKLYQVQVLTRHFHPRLYGHLKMRCMAEDMTFCFRWLLVCFKRDLGSLEDTMRFWDVLFACPYTNSYEVIVTVALLVALAPQIITHIHAYETLLQFMNVLSSGTTVDQILQCAREFYENVCVIEARELRRQHRHAIAHAAAAAGRPTAVPPPPPSSYAGVADSEQFPTVEEMVLLFLETDGPL